MTDLLLLLISPVLMIVSAWVLALTDAAWQIFGRRKNPADTLPSVNAATVVIPNWNGRDLLEKYLPSVEAALAGNAANEIIVVDNGSSDGSAEFLRLNFPGVKTLALERNLGFGGGSNAGIRAAANDIVVLLNSDMRVDAEFLAPLLAGFSDEKVFAVSCQIFLSDPAKRREETGLTEGRWHRGALRVGHRADEEVNELFPCFYGGGGSCAFDRKKMLELGGFDPLYEPFYLEDTDLGYLAWKRGWKVLYQPASIVYHEHRGTIGKKFRADEIAAVLKKNFILFAWKNIHDGRRITGHLFFSYAHALSSLFFASEPQLPNLAAIWRAFCALPRAARSRWRARSLAVVSDTEALLRPQGGYFRDRFARIDPAPRQLRVLFVSPYPICPPVHGGGLLMYETLRELTRLAEVHALVMLDRPEQLEANLELRTFCASAEFLVRRGSVRRQITKITPQGTREFANAELEWLIHRQLYLKRIDILQLEYSPLAQYARALPAHGLHRVRTRHSFPGAGARAGTFRLGVRSRLSRLRISARAALRAADAAELRSRAGLHDRQSRLPGQLSAADAGKNSGGAAGGHRYFALFISRRWARAGCHVVRGQLSPSTQSGGARMVRARNSAAHHRAAARRRGCAWWDPIRRSAAPSPTIQPQSNWLDSSTTFAPNWPAVRFSCVRSAAVPACA